MNTPRRRKRWRLLRWLLLIVLTPPLLWLAWNWNDEAPNAAALELSKPLAHGVADADNAWLLLVGMGAAEGEDPIALGRRRVDAFNANGILATMPPASSGDAVPLAPRLPQDTTPESCPWRIVNCLDWAQTHAPTLQRLREANALRLSRVARLQTLPQWDNVYRMAIDTPFAEIRDLHLYYDLTALDASNAIASGDAAALAAATQRMADTVRFFHRVQGRSQDLITVMVSVTAISRQYTLLDALLDRLDAGQIAALQPTLAAIVEAPAAAVDWSETLRREYQVVLHTTDDETLNIVTDYRRCRERGRDNCLSRSIAGLGFKPQATRNRMAENYLGILHAMQQPAPQLKAAMARAADEARERNPFADGFSGMLRASVYNPIGKVLAAMGPPDFNYAERVHDAEALRRSLVIKIQALQRGLAPADIAAFLATQPPQLANPWTGQPLDWDPRQREIGFVPVSTHFQRQRVGVRYQPRPDPGIGACAAPLRLELREVLAGKQRDAHIVLSCGSGNSAFVAQADQDSADRQRYADVRAVELDGRLDVQAWLLSDKGGLLLFETRGADAASTAPIWLDQAGAKGDGTRIELRLSRPADAAPMISAAVRALPANVLLQQIAAASPLRIAGTELAGTARIGLMFDIPAVDAVQLAAAAAGLEAEPRDEQHVVLRRTTATAAPAR